MSIGRRSRTSIADQKFRDYEMPANSDSTFWTDFGYTARRPFQDAAGLQELDRADARYPALFPRTDGEMRAGLARGFTPPRVTLQGRDNRSRPSPKGKPEDNLLYTPFREPMVGVAAADQDKLQAGSCRGDPRHRAAGLSRICSNSCATNMCPAPARRWRPKRAGRQGLVPRRRF